MNISLSKQALKYLNKQDRKNQNTLKEAILNLPKGSDIRYFKNSDTYRLRVGDFRILYYVRDCDSIHIDKIGPRGDIYK